VFFIPARCIGERTCVEVAVMGIDKMPDGGFLHVLGSCSRKPTLASLCQEINVRDTTLEAIETLPCREGLGFDRLPSLSMTISPELLVPLLALVVAFVLIGLNGFFVAAEFAIVKVRRTRLEELVGQGIAAARVSILCVDQLDEYLSATQLGITLSSLALGWVGEEAFAELLVLAFPDLFPRTLAGHHFAAIGISFFLVTMLHVVLGELVPKSMAIQDAERITLIVSRPLRWFYFAARPLLHSFTSVANFVLRRIGYHGLEEPPLTENELKLVMKESKEDGVISDSEAQIISRAFEFADKRASDIMVSRDQVKFLSLSQPLEKNLEQVRNKMHTRFPVCETDLDSVVGIVHMKDVWPILLTKFSNDVFLKSCRPPIFVDSSLRQDQLMKLFQSCRAHMAIVRNPATGRNEGIVTMEDVLETLVGDIRDEHGN
jgi:CBS domain containing-hemolysin-like protein